MPHMCKHIFEKAWVHVESICEGQSPSQILPIFTHDASNSLHMWGNSYIYIICLTNFFILNENVKQKTLSFGWCTSKLLNGRNLCHMSRIRVQIWFEIHNANQKNNLKNSSNFLFSVLKLESTNRKAHFVIWTWFVIHDAN